MLRHSSTLALILGVAGLVEAAAPVDYTVDLETVMTSADGGFRWFHPRAAPIPGGVIMTVQKWLNVSDYYSGLHVMHRDGVAGRWSGPMLPPALDWVRQPDGTTLSVADVTPGWHEKTGKLLAIGCRVQYSRTGRQLEDSKRSHQTVYAVFDPATSGWTRWRVLEMPAGEDFDFARSGCSQWVVKPDGTLLVPLYVAPSATSRFSATVAECCFDGETLVLQRHGSVLRHDSGRGLYEPSLASLGSRYYLTLRNDSCGYVTASDDGLTFPAPRPWTFDDGRELGSYNTQQHWLTHRDGLYLVYTRRGAGNDHIVRHRAPLFMARVDAGKLHVVRDSEQVVVPERSAELGNFGCARISERESWVTVSEGTVRPGSPERPAERSTFVARILWSVPDTPRP